VVPPEAAVEHIDVDTPKQGVNRVDAKGEVEMQEDYCKSAAA